MSRKKKEKQVRETLNSYYDYWLTRMQYVAASAIKWENLPGSCDPIFLENCLNTAGSAIIVKDDITGEYLVGQNGSTGPINIYGYPKDRRVIFLNGQTMNYEEDTSVIIYNNAFRSSDLWIFTTIANLLADMDAAVRINMNSQKTMPIIPVTETQRLTVENIYADITNNIPYVLVDGNALDVDKLKSSLQFDNRRSFTADLMIQVQREIWNRFLTFVGINNVNVEKRERVNVPEINSNLDEIFVMRRNRLNARERAAQLINEKWGMNIKVSYYSEEVTQDGGVYGGSQNDMRTAVSDESRVSRPENISGGEL